MNARRWVGPENPGQSAILLELLIECTFERRALSGWWACQADHLTWPLMLRLACWLGSRNLLESRIFRRESSKYHKRIKVFLWSVDKSIVKNKLVNCSHSRIRRRTKSILTRRYK